MLVFEINACWDQPANLILQILKTLWIPEGGDGQPCGCMRGMQYAEPFLYPAFLNKHLDVFCKINNIPLFSRDFKMVFLLYDLDLAVVDRPAPLTESPGTFASTTVLFTQQLCEISHQKADRRKIYKGRQHGEFGFWKGYAVHAIRIQFFRFVCDNNGRAAHLFYIAYQFLRAAECLVPMAMNHNGRGICDRSLSGKDFLRTGRH